MNILKILFCISIVHCSILSKLTGNTTMPNERYKELLKEQQTQWVNRIKKLSAKSEFSDNVSKNKICFYSYGSFVSGFTLPGVNDGDRELYVVKEKIEVVNRFSDDPLTLYETDEYWTAVKVFLKEYNILVIDYLKKQKEPRRPVRPGVMGDKLPGVIEPAEHPRWSFIDFSL